MAKNAKAKSEKVRPTGAALTLGTDEPSAVIVPVQVPEGALIAALSPGKMKIMAPVEIAGSVEPEQVTAVFLLIDGEVAGRCELVTPVMVGGGHALFLPAGGVIF
jgi:hypothetical protein